MLAAAALALVGAAAAPPPVRIEARSTDLLAIGIVHGDRMTIHLSRTLDNAPVRDAVVSVALRGIAHDTLAESDGGYSLQTPDLTLPGAATVQLQVTRGPEHEVLTGILQIAAASEKPEEKNSARQFGWWVLNFAVCIGFIMLWRRRKAAAKS
jgi:hypothetical protein